MGLPGRYYRHFKRYRKIASTLAKHGFGYALDYLGLSGYLTWFEKVTGRHAAGRRHAPTHDETLPGLSRGERLRLVLEELGPTAVKVGQMLSTRADLLPDDIIHEMGLLQDQVSAFPFDTAKTIIEKELGKALDELFISFDVNPLASASIGQVYKAFLKNGIPVVIKVQRPGIEETIEADLEILKELAAFLQRRTPWGRFYDFGQIVDELSWSLRNELDYLSEGENAERLKKCFSGDPGVRIPSVYWDYTTRRVLTLEYIEGIKISDLDRSHEGEVNRSAIARKIATAFMKQIFIDGFFHSDPHPGNVLVLEGGRIGLLDFGMVGFVTDHRKSEFVDVILGLTEGDDTRVARAVLDMGLTTVQVDEKALTRDISRLRSKYYVSSLRDIRVSDVMNDLFKLVFGYQIRMPSDFAMLGKCLITLEGTITGLDPTMNLMQVMKPFGKRLIRQRLTARNLGRLLTTGTWEYAELFLELPRQIKSILNLAQKNELKITTDSQDRATFLTSLERISNKLSLGMVLLAFSIVMAGLVVSSGLRVGTGMLTTFSRMPVLELGFVAALLMALWLLVSILRTGRF